MFEKYFNRIRLKIIGGDNTNSVILNMSTLATGSIIAKVIGFGLFPIITRLYLPADFGILSVFNSVISLLIPFSTLRYSITIPLPKNDGTALNIMVLCGLTTMILATFICVLFQLFGNIILSSLNMMEIIEYWWLLIVGFVGAGFYETLNNWAVRKKKFIQISKTTIWQVTSSTSAQIGLGFFGFGTIGLIIGTVINSGGGVISLFRYFYNDIRINFKHLTLNRLILISKYYKDLPIYRLPSQFLLVLSTKIPILYFAYNFEPDITGQLGLSLMVVGIPMGIIGTNTSKAYYAEIAKIGALRKDEISKLTKSIITRLGLISIVPIVLLMIFSTNLFQIFFGMQWELAGKITSILSIYLFFQFITSPIMNVFNVFNKQVMYLQVNIFRTLLLFIIFSISFYLEYDEINTIKLYSFLLSFHYVIIATQVFRLLRK